MTTKTIVTIVHGRVIVDTDEAPAGRCSLATRSGRLVGPCLDVDDFFRMTVDDLALAGLEPCPTCEDSLGWEWVEDGAPWNDKQIPCRRCGDGESRGIGVINHECQCGTLICDSQPLCPDCSANLAEYIEDMEACRED